MVSPKVTLGWAGNFRSSSTSEFSYLAQYINDPDFPPPMIRETRVFYVLLRGARTPLKKKVLNITLLLFSHSFVQKSFATGDLREPKVKAKAQYEPGSVDTYLRALFSVFSNHGITYRKDSHFNEKGDFQAYWKDTFAKTQAHREDYGTLPNASTFDDNFVMSSLLDASYLSTIVSVTILAVVALLLLQ